MKIAILSDLHLDFYTSATIQPLLAMIEQAENADVCLLAGDVVEAKNFQALHVQAVLTALSGKYPKVLAIAGNHEYYANQSIDASKAILRRGYTIHGITFLERESVVISGVQFIGATLWTNFGGDDSESFVYKMVAERSMNDFRYIKAKPTMKINPEWMLSDFEKSLQYIEESLKANNGGYNVVMTHHAPHFNSIPDRFRDNRSRDLNYAYASNLHRFIEKHQPMLWVHGHMHDPADYTLGGYTRVVSNPLGYPTERKTPLEIKVIEV